jgi:hypothetical protein
LFIIAMVMKVSWTVSKSYNYSEGLQPDVSGTLC